MSASQTSEIKCVMQYEQGIRSPRAWNRENIWAMTYDISYEWYAAEAYLKGCLL